MQTITTKQVTAQKTCPPTGSLIRLEGLSKFYRVERKRKMTRGFRLYLVNHASGERFHMDWNANSSCYMDVVCMPSANVVQDLKRRGCRL